MNDVFNFLFRRFPSNAETNGAQGTPAMMVSQTAAMRVFLAPGITDMRKSSNGLCAWVRGTLQADPTSGHLFVFFQPPVRSVRPAGDKLRAQHVGVPGAPGLRKTRIHCPGNYSRDARNEVFDDGSDSGPADEPAKEGGYQGGLFVDLPGLGRTGVLRVR